VTPPAGARVIELGDRLAVPGFIDNHTHFVKGGLQLSRVQLRDAASPDEFTRRIAAFARQLGPGAWITGGSWDEQLWDPPRIPTRHWIDAVTPDNPVFVSRLDIHMAVANALALRIAGITRDTPDPPGGTIGRDAAGEPDGVLRDAAMELVAAKIPPATLDERVAAIRIALAEAARLGVTSVSDMSWTDAFDDLRAYERIADDLTARVSLFAPIAEHARVTSTRRGHLRTGGLKGFADGSLGSSTAAMFEPFVGEPDNRGLVMEALANGSMKTWVAEADARGLQVAIHAIGDRANDAVLSIFESLPNFRERRFRVEHAQHLDAALIERFAAGRVIASMQPYHASDDGRWAETKIGRERAKTTYAFRTLLDAGAIVTFGSDWPVAPLNPILGIAAAVTRRTIDGRNPDGWIPEQKITVEEALRCYTVNNASAMFAEHETGRIAPGMLADIAVLSQDVFAIPPEAIVETEVDVTIFDGRVIYER
jgi:predicted amidohydrolase YtcJ